MKSNHLIQKADILLATVLVAAGLLLSFVFSFGDSLGGSLKITADGKEFGTYSLLEDQTVTIKRNGHHNVVRIEDGSVSMVSSDCSGQDCVHQHSISRSGETIVCLPNRVVLEIYDGEDGYDTISK